MPNFSPLVAIALFSGVYFKKRFSFLIPLLIYIISDIIIGLHATIVFTWSSIVIIYLAGKILARHKTPFTIALYTIFSSVFFFVFTNYGVWLLGWYPHTFSGLLQCYIAALPFFRTSLVANLIYAALLFGLYEYFLRKNIASSRQESFVF